MAVKTVVEDPLLSPAHKKVKKIKKLKRQEPIDVEFSEIPPTHEDQVDHSKMMIYIIMAGLLGYSTIVLGKIAALLLFLMASVYFLREVWK